MTMPTMTQVQAEDWARRANTRARINGGRQCPMTCERRPDGRYAWTVDGRQVAFAAGIITDVPPDGVPAGEMAYWPEID